jgi:UPF0755 protein
VSENERTEQEREAARLAREARRNGTGTSPAARPTSVPQPAAAPPPLAIETPTATIPTAPPVPRTGRAGRPPRTPRTSRRARAPRNSEGPSPAPRRRAGSRRVPLILLALFSILVAAVIWFLISLFEPFTGSGSGSVRVIVPGDSSSSQVGTLLKRDGVISSSFFFKLRVDLSGDHFDAGTYTLAHGMSYGAVLKRLTGGPTLPPTENVTIIPGKSRYQLNQLLRAQGVKGSYSRSTLTSPVLNPQLYGAPKSTPSLEGFLYPDTYQVRKPLAIGALVTDQLIRFKQEIKTVNLTFAASRKLTAYDVLKIASLEDAEAALPSDLPKVASVIYNRLHLGMDLGLDTTAAYASNNYSGNLSAKQLSSASPWNTLNHRGLPPTPIDSPDVVAIRAAAHPASTGYLYFIVKVCGNGALNFTANYEQFLIWSRQYSAALAKRGATKAEFCSHHG